MQDAITSVINSSDVQGKYLDTSAMERLKATSKLVNCSTGCYYNQLQRGCDRPVAVSAVPDITRPGGNMYTTRRYACLYSRFRLLPALFYHAMAGDPSFWMSVLNGLKETTPWVFPSVRPQSIQAMKEATASLVGPDAGKEMGAQTTSALAELGDAVSITT